MSAQARRSVWCARAMLSVAAICLPGCHDGTSNSPPPDVQAPSVPTGIAVTVMHPTQTKLTWTGSADAGSGVAGYHVYRNGIRIASTGEEVYVDSEVLPGGRYRYAVSAYDKAQSANESEPSLPVDVAVTYSVSKMCDVSGESVEVSAIEMNGQGQVVGQIVTESGTSHGFIYSDGTMTDLSTLVADANQVTGINDAGQIVGATFDSSGIPKAFLYDDGVAKDLGTLGGVGTFPNDINNSGQIVGISNLSDNTAHAFLYQDGKMMDLGTLGGAISNAWKINDAGTVVGTSDTATSDGGLTFDFRSSAFIYKGGAMTNLGRCRPDAWGESFSNIRLLKINNLDQLLCSSNGYAVAGGGNPPGEIFLFASYLFDEGGAHVLDMYGIGATDINDLGQVIGGYFFYSGGTMTSLEPLWAYDVNDVGQVVGHDAGKGVAALYAGGQVWDLNDLVDEADPLKGSIVLVYGHLINDSGQIVAYGNDSSGSGACGTYFLTLTAATPRP